MDQLKELYKVSPLNRYSLILCLCSSLIAPFAYGDLIDDIEDLEPKSGVGSTEAEDAPTPKAPVSGAQPKKEVKTSPTKIVAPSPKKSNKEAAKAPIKIKSEGKSSYSRNGGLIVLRENVVITQDELRLQADKASVFVDNKAAKGESVRKVEITGQVKVSRFDKDPAERVTAHGNKAIFINKKQTVKLIGNARLFKGGHLIKGKEIVYDIQSGMITVDEAQGVVQPEESPNE